DNGTLTCRDYNMDTAFQMLDDIPQPDSLEAQSGMFCSTFNMTGSALILDRVDKVIK
ncbi:uncharacterized protein LAESUDRAFT_663632, partial [Laetiporus sulphureus 93-53]